jgi:hypothetical protein
MKRWILIAATSVSCLLLVFTLVMMGCSVSHVYAVCWIGKTGASSDPGYVGAEITSSPWRVSAAWGRKMPSHGLAWVLDETGTPVQITGFIARPMQLGFRHGSVELPAMTAAIPVRDRLLPSIHSFYLWPTALLLPMELEPARAYFFPTWYLLAAEAMLPSLWLIRKRKSRRGAFEVLQTSQS